MRDNIFTTAMTTFEAYTKQCMDRDRDQAPYYLTGKYEAYAAIAIAKLHAFDPQEAERLLNTIHMGDIPND